MTIRGGELHVTGRQVFRQAPANLIRVFAEAQRHGVGLSQLTKKCIRDERTLITDGMQRDPDAVAAFLDILRSRSRVYEAIREMHKEGILIHFIPEFANLLCRVQRDMHHIYTVDEHSLRGILELERLRAGEYARICPLLTEVMRETDGVDLLFLAMLFHDLGKGYGHGHSERGALLVREISARLGLNSDDAQQLEFLVRNHLLMSHLAQHRDIHDDDLVQGFARDVGDVSTLRKLYLLTFADMQAVGPRFWNNWRDMLLGELYIRTLRALERGGSVEENPAARVARVQDRIRRATPANRNRVEAFLASMPSSYFLTTPEEMIPGHVLLVERLERAVAEGSAEVTTALRHFPEWDYSEFTVCTADRPGLFSMLAGVIAAADINVLSARIATSTNGTALDVFRLSHTQRREAAIEDTRWERVRRNVEAVLTGEVEVETLVDASRRPSPLSRPRKSSPRDRTAVVVDNAISRDHTVLDVHTSDRIGLLFVITRCLYRLGLEIRLAKITTTLEQVLDVFYVSERDGRKIEDAARLDEITRVLTERLLEDAATANSTQG